MITTIRIETDYHGNCTLRIKRAPIEEPHKQYALIEGENYISEAEALRRVLEVFDLPVVPVTTTQVAGFRLLEVAP